jgi:hypothetical protein
MAVTVDSPNLTWKGVSVTPSPGRSVGKTATSIAARPASELRRPSQEKSRSLYTTRNTPIAQSPPTKSSRRPE